MRKDRKLDEHILGMTSIGRLQQLAGINTTAFSQDSDQSRLEEIKNKFRSIKEGKSSCKSGKKKKMAEDFEEDDMPLDLPSPDHPEGLDVEASHDVESDPMGDAGVPGEIGADPIEDPLDDVEDDLEADIGADLGIDDMDMGDEDDLVDMGSLDTGPTPMGVTADPMGGMDTMSQGDAKTEIENALSTISSLAPDIKISNYRDVVQRAEEVVAQLRSMGSQYLREGSKISVEAGKMTLREAAKRKGGYYTKLLESYSKSSKRHTPRRK